MLTINKLRVKFNEQVALDIQGPIIFENGDRIGIIGSNGAGKSTLIKTILGLLPYDGQIMTTLSTKDMAVHLQENNYAEPVPIKNIIEGILGEKITDNQRLQELVNFFDFESCLKKKVKQLSGGQRQRLTIILVLMQDAKLTFFDEVTSGLDFETRQQLMQKINLWYQNSNQAVCVVSHYYDELDVLANKILLLEQGQVVAFGKREELFEKYCGKSIITVDNLPEIAQILQDYQQLIAPLHLLAYACDNIQTELAIPNLCIKNNINFKRSDNDIEIMSMNAKKAGGFYHE